MDQENELNDFLQEMANGAESDVLAVLGYLAKELTVHTPQEEIIDDCSSAIDIDKTFLRELIKDCLDVLSTKLAKGTS